jgi:putative sigma-54 modulation protein
MQLSVSGHHIEITESLRKYVGTKLSKLERHFDQMTDIHCVLTVEHVHVLGEDTIHLGVVTFVAESIELNMYAAIDILADKLDRQVKKHKEKVTDHHAREVERFR